MRKISYKVVFNACLALMLITFCSAIISLFSGQSIRYAFAIENNITQHITEDDKFEEGSIIVVLNSESSRFRGVSDNIIKKLTGIGGKSIDDLSEIPKQYVNGDGSINCSAAPSLAAYYENSPFKQILYVKLQETTKKSVIDAIAKVEKFSEVEYVGPNWIQETGDFVPNDTYYSDQWALNTSKGIDVEAAWDISRGVNTVRVGIIDSGIATHNDLDAHVQTGYDYYNKNTVTNDDGGGHGTHVAGIIGAIGNNSLGISGVAPNITLVPLQTAYNTSGSGLHYTNERLEAIKEAIKLWEDESQRISILNHSIAGFGTNTEIAAAVGNFPGLFVWSAGNNKANTDNMSEISKFDLPNVISVGALNSESKWASFSNYGLKSVNIYAPGENILSTYPKELCNGETVSTLWGTRLMCECTLTESYGEWQWVPSSTHYENGYHYMSGTSMAAPHVTGVAALLLSHDPTLTGSDLKDIILNNADDITIDTPKGEQNVKKLNAYKALNLLANIDEKTYTVRFHHIIDNGDEIFQIGVKYGDLMPLPWGKDNAPQRTGYEFVGYYSDVNGNGDPYYTMEIMMDESCIDIDDQYYEGLVPQRRWLQYKDGDLYACWKLLKCNYTYLNVKYKDGYFDETSTVKLTHGEQATITAKSFDGYNFLYFYREGVQYTTSTVIWDMELKRSGSSGKIVPKYSFFAVYEAVKEDTSPCVTTGTLITLDNGEQVPVEQLKGDEMLLVWNLYTGTFDSAPILFIDCDPLSQYEVINLYFSDGTQVKVVYEHAFWDFDLNEYIYLREDAAKYIGHWFNKQTTKLDGSFESTRVQLTSVVIQDEYTATYSPVTYGHLCYYVNGMLSMPGGIDGLFNIFEVDGETLTYNSESMAKDIEQYGLFTYEEFAEILPVPEEIFNAFSGQYLKVAIGKGLIDFETLTYLVERYQKFF